LNTSISADRLAPSRPILKIALPALPWSGFTTISPCSAEEGAGFVERAGESVGGMKRAKSSTHTFLGRVADRGGIVDHQRLALDPLEQVGGGDVAEVEGRVLAHQHDVGVAAEVEDRGLAEA
jgi:hypothetical protein